MYFSEEAISLADLVEPESEAKVNAIFTKINKSKLVQNMHLMYLDSAQYRCSPKLIP